MYIDQDKLQKMSITEIVQLAELDYSWYIGIGCTPDEYNEIQLVLTEEINNKLIFIFSYQMK